MKIRRQDIVTAFGLDEYVEEAKKKGKAQGGKASGSGGGSAKKR
jgi:mevalonate kinase